MEGLAGAALLVFVALMGVDRPPLPLPGHGEWADLAMLVATAAAVLLWSTRRLAWRLELAATAGAVAYAAWAALSACVHGAGGWKALGIAELVCVAAVTAALTSGVVARDRLLRVWIYASVALALVALTGAGLALARVPSVLYDPRGGDLNLPWRARGLCVTSNLLASQLIAPLALLVADGSRLVGPRRRNLALAVIGLAFLLTLSRSWLSAALAAVLFSARGWRRAASVALLIIAALASARLDLYRAPDGRVTVSTAPGLRWRLAGAALGAAAAHPLVGVGPSALPAVVDWPRPGDPPTEMAAHSTVLDVASRLGLPALAAFLLVCVRVLRRGARTAGDRTRAVLFCALAAVLFDGLTVDVESFRHLWLLLGLVGTTGEA